MVVYGNVWWVGILVVLWYMIVRRSFIFILDLWLCCCFELGRRVEVVGWLVG